MSLRDLDERVVPAAAARLRGAVSAWEEARAGVVRRAASLRPEQLDRRFTDVVLVARLREQPLLGALAALALLVAGLGAAVAVDHEPAGLPAVPAVVDVGERPAPGFLGPAAGERTDAYERTATQGLVRAVQRNPAEPRVALVSLADYRTPAEAVALLAGFDVERVFLRARGAGGRAATLPVDVRGDLTQSLTRAYADTARNREAAARSYQGYVDTLTGTSKEDKAFRELYASFARSSRIEAKAYGSGCACVLGMLVTASPAQLLTLRARPGVRAVEVAEAGLTASTVQVQPLLPEAVGVVPRAGAGT